MGAFFPNQPFYVAWPLRRGRCGDDPHFSPEPAHSKHLNRHEKTQQNTYDRALHAALPGLIVTHGARHLEIRSGSSSVCLQPVALGKPPTATSPSLGTIRSQRHAGTHIQRICITSYNSGAAPRVSRLNIIFSPHQPLQVPVRFIFNQAAPSNGKIVPAR